MLIKIDHPLPSSEEMRKSVTDKLANGERLGASHDVDYATTEARVLTHMGYSVLAPPDAYANGTVGRPLEYSKLAPSTKARWDECKGRVSKGLQDDVAFMTRRGPPRKHISERTCHGKDVACLPGLNGKCVACFNDD